MKPSEVLRRAARNIELGRWLCGCIEISMVVWREIDQRKFTEEERASIEDRVMDYFKQIAPLKTSFSRPWWPIEESGPRIIGLCLAAAIAESEGE